MCWSKPASNLTPAEWPRWHRQKHLAPPITCHQRLSLQNKVHLKNLHLSLWSPDHPHPLWEGLTTYRHSKFLQFPDSLTEVELSDIAKDLLPLTNHEVVDLAHALHFSEPDIERMMKQSSNTHDRLLVLLHNFKKQCPATRYSTRPDKMGWNRKPDDYQYPGIFQHEHSKRVAYFWDITALPFFDPGNKHFMSQQGKHLRYKKTTANIDRKREEICYKIAPCKGVKVCSVDGCSYVTSSQESKPCPHHLKSQLESSGNSPVDFFYVWLWWTGLGSRLVNSTYVCELSSL